MPSEALMNNIEKMVETIFLGMMATLFGIVFAIPVSFLAARNLMSGSWVTMAVYFLTRSPKLIPESLFMPLIAALSLVGGVHLGWVEKSTSLGGGFDKVKKAVGVAMILVAIALPLLPRFITPAEGIGWLPTK